MIRLAHFSDLHYGTKNLAEADRCFGAAIDRAIALGRGVGATWAAAPRTWCSRT